MSFLNRLFFVSLLFISSYICDPVALLLSEWLLIDFNIISLLVNLIQETNINGVFITTRA